jgi:hypothetical protein
MGESEQRDVNVGGVSKAAVGIVALVLVAAGLMWFLFGRFAAREARRSPRPEPMAASNPQKEPPEPRLQKASVMDLKNVQAGEEVILNQYAWIDPGKGIVRIPVARAMQLVAREGLPSR